MERRVQAILRRKSTSAVCPTFPLRGSGDQPGIHSKYLIIRHFNRSLLWWVRPTPKPSASFLQNHLVDSFPETMRSMVKQSTIALWVLALVVSASLQVVVSANPQIRDPIGDFTKSSTEHIIIEIGKPFVVRDVAGSFHHGDDRLPGVLLEIQGPGDDKKIRSTMSDDSGRFKIKRVPQGTYRFKTTLNGFESVMGTIIVSKKAHSSSIQIKIPVGM